MTPAHKGKLPRLGRHHYQGHTVVFWTNTLEERARDWLTPVFHATFRELMLLPGYPSVHPLADGFWQLFWKLYGTEREAEPPPPKVPPLSV